MLPRLQLAVAALEKQEGSKGDATVQGKVPCSYGVFHAGIVPENSPSSVQARLCRDSTRSCRGLTRDSTELMQLRILDFVVNQI